MAEARESGMPQEIDDPAILDVEDSPWLGDEDEEGPGFRRAEFDLIAADGRTAHVELRSGSGMSVSPAREAAGLPSIGFGGANRDLREAAADFAEALGRDGWDAASAGRAARAFVVRAGDALGAGAPDAEAEAVLLAAGSIAGLRAGDVRSAAEATALVRSASAASTTPAAASLSTAMSSWLDGWTAARASFEDGPHAPRLAAARDLLAKAAAQAVEGLKGGDPSRIEGLREAAGRAAEAISEAGRSSWLAEEVAVLGRAARLAADLRFSGKDSIAEAMRGLGGLARSPEAGRSGEAVRGLLSFASLAFDAYPREPEAIVAERIRVGEASIDALRRADEAAWGGDSSRNDSGQDGGMWEARSGAEWSVRFDARRHGRAPFVAMDASAQERARQAAGTLPSLVASEASRAGLARLAADMLRAEEEAAGLSMPASAAIDVEELMARRPGRPFADVLEEADRLRSAADHAARMAAPPSRPVGREVRLGGGVETRMAEESVLVLIGAAEIVAGEMAAGCRTRAELVAALESAASSGSVPLSDSLKVHAAMVARQAADRAGALPERPEPSRIAVLAADDASPAMIRSLIERNVPARSDGGAIEAAACSRSVLSALERMEAEWAARRAAGERLPQLLPVRAKSIREAGTGAQIAIGVWKGAGNEYDKAIALAMSRDMAVVAVDHRNGKPVWESDVRRTLRGLEGKASRDAEEARKARFSELEAAGLSMTEDGVHVFGDASVLSGRLLSCIGWMDASEVEAARSMAREGGFDGIAWFASPMDPSTLPPAGLDPRVVGMESMGSIGRFPSEWTARAVVDGAKAWDSPAGSVEALPACLLPDAPGVAEHAAFLPGRPARETVLPAADGLSASVRIPATPDRVAWHSGGQARVHDVAVEVPAGTREAGLSAIVHSTGARLPAEEALRAGLPPSSFFLVRGLDASATGMAVVKRLDDRLCVVRAAGGLVDFGRPEASPRAAVGIASDPSGRPVRIARVPAGADAIAAIEEAGRLCRGAIDREAVRPGLADALAGRTLVARRLPPDLALADGLPRSLSSGEVGRGSLKAYCDFASDFGPAEGVSIVGAKESELRSAAMERGWRMLTAEQHRLLPIWEKAGEVARAAAKRAGGFNGRFPYALATEAIKARGLEGGKAEALRSSIVNHPLSRVAGREMALSAMAVLEGDERKAIQSAFPLARMAVPQAGRMDPGLSMPAELADCSSRIADLAGSFGRSSGREMAKALEARGTDAGKETARWARTSAGTGPDAAEKVAARVLVEESIGRGDVDGAFHLARAAMLRRVGSGRAIEAARESSSLGR